MSCSIIQVFKYLDIALIGMYIRILFEYYNSRILYDIFIFKFSDYSNIRTEKNSTNIPNPICDCKDRYLVVTESAKPKPGHWMDDRWIVNCSAPSTQWYALSGIRWNGTRLCPVERGTCPFGLSITEVCCTSEWAFSKAERNRDT